MKTFLIQLKSDPLCVTGLVLLVTCTIIFCLPENTGKVFFSTKFLFAYLSFIGYFIAVLADNKQQTRRLFSFYSLPHNIMLLLLGNLSAYSLNLAVSIFEPSATWLSVFLVLLNFVLAITGFRQKFEPDWWNHVTVAIISAGILLQFYQTIYIVPLMGYGLLFFWFFGFTLHAFLPLWFLISLSMLLRRFVVTSKSYWRGAVVGLALPVAFLVGFIARWNGVSRHLEQVHHETLAPLEEEGLPEWVMVGQRLDEDWMTKRILNSRVRPGFEGLVRRASFFSGESTRHDPFIVVASLFSKRAELPEDQLDRLRDALYNSRHKTEPRLWSGDKLSTNDIVTNVQLFPEYRLAYTEKTLTIENTSKLLRQQQEAIYSFYLPEGSVATSASLWIGDREEKAYLTTRSKADSAYQTIVGRERRDPMLVRWQEGNRVSVRVFPCTPEEKRKFKIGITSPLRFEAGKLVYKNIDLEGCKKDGAKETVQVLVEGEPVKFSSSLSFQRKGNHFRFSGSYQPDWNLSFIAPSMSEQAFTFNGRSFQLHPLPDFPQAATYREIYLDVNDGWSKRQFNEIWKSVRDKEVFAWLGGMVKLTEENKDEIFRELKGLNYSVFPFHKIFHPEEAIVVTAPCGFSPVAGDLSGSVFLKNMQEFFAQNQHPVKVLNIGKEISPYLKGLDEIRSLHVYIAKIEEAGKLLASQQFPAFQEDAETIVIESAGMKIQVLPEAAVNSQAPDHLLRLFAYNDLMKKLGKNYFDLNSAQEALIGQAQEAYIVTPVSNLVSLETQEDYERFDIRPPSENSLKNASIKSPGAVPEPQEWLLILLCLTAAFLLFGRNRCF